jgi:hypothetical protein
MDKSLMEMKEKLTKELTELVNKRDITVSDLDVIYKAVKSIYYLTTIGAMNEYSQDSYGRSMDGRSMDMNSYRSGYSDGYSNARRGRDGDSDGRYSESYGFGHSGYSGHDSKEHMIEDIRKMMPELGQREQQAAREFLNRIQG